jgi:two-component system nitrogen regulation sensor histidine kinase GlnL
VLRLAENEAGWAVRLQRDYDPSIPEFHGDADRLTQAVWNLVRNAIQAGAGNITLRTRVEHGVRIRRAVAHDGTAPGSRRRRPWRARRTGRTPVPAAGQWPRRRHGLGLALAQQVAREHRGTLTYRSRPGHTVFTLLLPIGNGAAPAEEAPRDV